MPNPIPNQINNNTEINIQNAIQRAMKGSQGNNKGYFTLDDFIFSMLAVPNERWTQNEIEQTLYFLVEQGQVRELEVEGGRERVSLSQLVERFRGKISQ